MSMDDYDPTETPRKRRGESCTDHACGGCPACMSLAGIVDDDPETDDEYIARRRAERQRPAVVIALAAMLMLAGCGSVSRQINPADSHIPIYRTEHDALQRLAAGPGSGINHGVAYGLAVYGDVPGSPDYGHPAIHYSADLTQTASIAVLLYEGLGRMYVRRTGDTRIWDLLDDLGSPAAIAGFPVQDPHFPGRQVLAWDQSEKALRLRAEYAAVRAARQVEAKP